MVENSFNFKTANTLPNGAQILTRYEAPEWVKKNGCRLCFVLAYVKGSYQPYVTWRVDPQTGEAYWGHYFREYRGAVENFELRCLNK